MNSFPINDLQFPAIDDIVKAYELIKPYINRTPVMTSSTLNSIFGCSIYFKCENFQKVGAFKFRGASNAIWSLTEEEASRGVATHSSGNHAQALSLAARMRGISATIVMPDNSPMVKKDAVAAYGGRIIFCKPTLEARESTLKAEIEKSGAREIHPYNNFQVISGQGTAALEMLEDVPKLDYLLTPVGGGGLLSGTLITVSSLSPDTKVIAAEPKGADDAYRSILKGEIVPSVNPKTIADGLLTSLGTLTFPIIKKHINRIITVSEDSIKAAMRLVWERMKIIIEPSSATTLSVIMENTDLFASANVGIIISGGNVDLGHLPF